MESSNVSEVGTLSNAEQAKMPKTMVDYYRTVGHHLNDVVTLALYGRDATNLPHSLIKLDPVFTKTFPGCFRFSTTAKDAIPSWLLPVIVRIKFKIRL